MTQQVVHSRVKLKSTSVFGDDVTMDFYFEATGTNTSIDWASPTNPDEVLIDFFNEVGAGMSAALCTWISPDMSRLAGDSQINTYDVTAHLNGSIGSPLIRSTPWQLNGTDQDALPPGCAALVGYRAAYATDVEHVGATRPRARDRGRFFFGPLTKNAILASGGKLETFFKLNLITAFQILAGTHNPGGPNQFDLVQWSRRNAAVKDVEFFFIDEACAYQRRRADDTANRVHTWQPL